MISGEHAPNEGSDRVNLTGCNFSTEHGKGLFPELMTEEERRQALANFVLRGQDTLFDVGKEDE